MSLTSSSSPSPSPRRAADRREFLLAGGFTTAALALAPSLRAFEPPRGRQANVGLVGAGRQGRALLAELQKIDALNLVAVCDPNEAGCGPACGGPGKPRVLPSSTRCSRWTASTR